MSKAEQKAKDLMAYWDYVTAGWRESELSKKPVKPKKEKSAEVPDE